VISAVLYILIFWKFIWEKITIIPWINYIDFIFPWLLMMSIIMWSYSLTSFWFFSSKMFKSIEELLVSSISYNKIIIWYCLAWISRWILVWISVFLVSLLLVQINITSYFYLFLFVFLTSIVFSLAWLLNWIFAKNFDDVNIFPSFVITPLIYLGWVFYSIDMLSPFWQYLSQFNPILYMINWLRYAFIWFSDVNIYYSIIILITFIIVLYSLCLYLLKKWYWIKS
jgi:ABC-2 type transport system permease protein